MPKPLYQSVSSCFKKSRYPTEDRALKSAKKAMAERGQTLRVYYCKVCCGFHLTQKPLMDFAKSS